MKGPGWRASRARSVGLIRWLASHRNAFSSLGLRVLTRDFSAARGDVKRKTPRLQNTRTGEGRRGQDASCVPRRTDSRKHSFGRLCAEKSGFWQFTLVSNAIDSAPTTRIARKPQVAIFRTHQTIEQDCQNPDFSAHRTDDSCARKTTAGKPSSGRPKRTAARSEGRTPLSARHYPVGRLVLSFAVSQPAGVSASAWHWVQ